jgi:hypothetical protein
MGLPTATNAPEQIRVLLLTGFKNLTVRKDDLSVYYVVNGCAVFAGGVSDATA